MIDTAVQLSIYQEGFDKFDTNGNGGLMGDELRVLAGHQFGEGVTEEQLASMIAQLDTNADGRVELTEYLGWVGDEQRNLVVTHMCLAGPRSWQKGFPQFHGSVELQGTGGCTYKIP